MKSPLRLIPCYRNPHIILAIATRPHVRKIYQKREVLEPLSLQVQVQVPVQVPVEVRVPAPSRHRSAASVKTVSTFPPKGLFAKDAATIARSLAKKLLSRRIDQNRSKSKKMGGRAKAA